MEQRLPRFRYGRGVGLVVLDSTPRNGGDASRAELERVPGPLPETLYVQAGVVSTTSTSLRRLMQFRAAF